MTTPHPTPSAVHMPQKKGCFLFSCGGCLGLGCLFAVLVALLSLGGLYYAGNYFIPNVVMSMTDERPLVSPIPANSPGLRSSISTKLTELFLGVSQNRREAGIEITRQELAHIVPYFIPSGAGSVQLDAVGDQMTALFSIPVDLLTKGNFLLSTISSGAENRFVNGRVSLRPIVANSLTSVAISELRIASFTVPQNLLRPINSVLTSLLMVHATHFRFPKGHPMERNANISVRISRLEVRNDALYLSLAPYESLASATPIPAPPVDPHSGATTGR